MSIFTRGRAGKAGLPPGALVRVAEAKRRPTEVTLIQYNETDYREQVGSTLGKCPASPGESTVTWVNVDRLHQVDVLTEVSDCFGLHPLVAEDILTPDQRPKIEDYGHYLYIVLKMLRYGDHVDGIVAEQVSVVLGQSFVLSFQEQEEGDVFGPVREHLRASASRIRRSGADYLAYALLDAVIDNYFVILERLGEKVELLEERLMDGSTPETLRQIHRLRREVILLRKSIWPLREVIGGLQRGESPLVRETTRLYLRDIYDHTIEVIDSVETVRDMLTVMLDMHLSSVSNRLNAVMKVLTIISTIFLPLTLLASVYGMNFEFIPGLHSPWGFPMTVVAMIAVAGAMLMTFRAKGWL